MIDILIRGGSFERMSDRGLKKGSDFDSKILAQRVLNHQKFKLTLLSTVKTFIIKSKTNFSALTVDNVFIISSFKTQNSRAVCFIICSKHIGKHKMKQQKNHFENNYVKIFYNFKSKYENKF